MVRWAVSSPYLYSVTGPLSSYTPMHFALTIALGGRYCERLHLQDVEHEAQRCDDTCPRPHSQEVVELGPACNHPSWGFRAHTGYIPALECGALRQRWGCRSLAFWVEGPIWLPCMGPRLPSTGWIQAPFLQLAGPPSTCRSHPRLRWLHSLAPHYWLR